MRLYYKTNPNCRYNICRIIEIIINKFFYFVKTSYLCNSKLLNYEKIVI